MAEVEKTDREVSLREAAIKTARNPQEIEGRVAMFAELDKLGNGNNRISESELQRAIDKFTGMKDPKDIVNNTITTKAAKGLMELKAQIFPQAAAKKPEIVK